MEPLIGFYPIPTSAPDRYVFFCVVESAQKNPLLYENIPLLFEPHKKHTQNNNKQTKNPPPKCDINIKQQVSSLCGDLCNMHSKIQFDTVSSNRYFC